MKTFKQYIKESIDATAGVSFGEGENAERYRFKVSDLIAHAEQQDGDGNYRYPVQHLDPKSMADNLEARRGSESPESERQRTKNADVRFPIIATHRPDGSLHVLDGTHRLGAVLKAIKDNHETNNHETIQTIPVRIIPREHLQRFRI